MSRSSAAVIDELLAFWFGMDNDNPEASSKVAIRWYRFDAEIDREIAERFGDVFEEARQDRLSHWAESALGSLALVVLLDQFSRNLKRKSREAFSQDALARAIAKRSISQNFFEDLHIPGRVVLLHPFHHSENFEDQLFGLRLIDQLVNQADAHWRPYLTDSQKFFKEHAEVIRRFGRFPHRNKVLERTSSDAEKEYLKSSSNFGQ